MAKLNSKQAAFCREYIVDSNGLQAAIRAGYSGKSAKVTASRLLTRANIQAEIRRLSAKKETAAICDAEYLDRVTVEIIDENRAGTDGDRKVCMTAVQHMSKRLCLLVDRSEVTNVDAAKQYASEVVRIVFRHVKDQESRDAILADLEAMGGGGA